MSEAGRVPRSAFVPIGEPGLQRRPAAAVEPRRSTRDGERSLAPRQLDLQLAKPGSVPNGPIEVFDTLAGA